METMNCKECGERVSLKEMAEASGFCPKCKKVTSWRSDPEFFSNE